MERNIGEENYGKRESRAETAEDEMMGRRGECERNSERRRVKCAERQKLNKFNWRPHFKQRGLFSDRDPSQETELENRLIEAFQVAR